MRRRYAVIVCCLMIVALFSGCQMRRPGPGEQQGGNNPNISAAKDRADSYDGVVTKDTNAQTGMDGAKRMTYTVRSGNRVRIMGKYDGYYVAVLPNNQVGLIPINSVKTDSPSASRSATPTPPTGDGTNMMQGGQTGITPGDTTGNRTGTTPGGAAGNQPGAPSGGLTGGRLGVPGDNRPVGTQATEGASMINLVNQARSQAGLKPLSSDASVAKLADMKASDMAKNNYFSHNSPTYGSPFDMLKKNDVSYLYAGENLARDQNVQSAHKALMNSPDHKANILNPNFTNIGIGIAQRNDGSKVYVQMFIGK